MDNIFGSIVLVLAWHISGDDSGTKGPQTNQYVCCYGSIYPKKCSKSAILTKTNGLLVTNGQYFWSYCPSVGLAHIWG